MNVNINKDIQKSFYDNFEQKCISALVEGYYKAIEDNNYKIDWKENNFTNYLASFIRETLLIKNNCIWVKVQEQPINNNIPEEETENDPDRQPIIDMWLANWNNKEKNEYFIEAKNICENDWVKSNGSLVSSSKLKRRYIATGIENFISKRYPKGSLVGYVIKSNSNNCVDGINNLLKKDKRDKEILVWVNLIECYKNTFCSTHYKDIECIKLNHIFLEFK